MTTQNDNTGVGTAIALGTLGVGNGGTGASLSATGGAADVLMQESVGAAITVRRLLATDIPAGTTTATAFGDSITHGWVNGGLDQADAYATLLAASMHWTLTNSGADGTLIQDSGQIDAMMGVTVGATDNYFILSGYNDMRVGGTTAANQTTYQDGLYSALAWLAIPDAHKRHAVDATITYGGVWSSAAFSGKSTVTNGATATVTLYGSTIYISSTRVSAQSGTFTVTVDGVSYGTFNCFGNTGTPNGRLYVPFLVRIANLPDKPHTVIITKSGGDVVYFNWAAGASGSITSTGPNVFVGNCLRMNTTGYTLGNPTYSNGSDTAVYQYNKIIRNVTRDLAADGLNVVYVDASAYYDPSTSDGGSDNTHPSVTGHAKIASAFLAQILATAQGRDRAGANLWSGAIPYQAYGESPAQAGTIRLANAATIAWRNAANTADANSVTTDSSGLIAFSGAVKGFSVTSGQINSSTQFRSRCTNAAAQTITNITLTALTFDTNLFDVGGVHSTSVATSHLTVPTGGAGVWIINAQAGFVANAGGFRAVQIRKNGATVIADNRSSVNSGADFQYINVTAIDVASDADYYEIIVYQSSGGNLNVNGTNATTYASAMKVY